MRHLSVSAITATECPPGNVRVRRPRYALPRNRWDGTIGAGIGMLLSAAVFCAPAGADTTYAAIPLTYRQLLLRLHPGDTLSLAPGEYRDGLPLVNLSGAPGQPITISGPANGRPATFVAEQGRNTISIVDAQHLVIRNLTLEGRDLPVDAVKAEGHAHFAHHITLENLVIHGHGNNQQTVAISTKCPAWDWIIRGNTIIAAGTGMYLGNSDGRAPFVAGLIEDNLIVNTIGYNLQVKHQLPRPNVPGMPSGSSVTVIRHNVFAKPEGGTAEAARPNVLVGHFPLEGPGVDDRYVVYGNFFYQNRHESLFQGEGNIALYDNLFVNRYGDAVRIRPHNDVPKRVDVAFNTVVAAGAGISILRKEGSLVLYSQSVMANVVFAGVPVSGGEASHNVALPYEEAARYLAQPFASLGQLDLYPRAPWPDALSSQPGNPGDLPDWDRDFNGRLRKPGSIGAYGESGADLGWLPHLDRMPSLQ